jgi:hypothetical protein
MHREGYQIHLRIDQWHQHIYVLFPRLFIHLSACYQFNFHIYNETKPKKSFEIDSKLTNLTHFSLFQYKHSYTLTI